jgi:hypothetical protein
VNGFQSRALARCPKGKVPLGGGAFILSNSTRASINSSFPSGRDWVADVNNASGLDTTFTVTAICGVKPAGYAIATASAPNPSGTQVSAQAICPAGTLPLGGGGLSSSGQTFVNLNSSIPFGNRWRADVNNGSGADADFTALAVCGTLKGYTTVTGPPETNQANTQSLAQASGGGAFSDSTSIGVNINTTHPGERNGWDSFENNATALDAHVRTVVACAGS